MNSPSGAARRKCLYLATFDPTGGTTGTATRGRMFLRCFAGHFETHLVYMKEAHQAGTDRELIASLASVRAADYSKGAYFVFSRRLFQLAAEVLRSGTFDLIFADFEKAGLYARLLSRRFGVPYVYNSHNVEYLRYLDFARMDLKRSLFVPYLYLVERWACRGSLLSVAISEHDASSFRKWLPPERLLVLPCAFDEQVIHPHYPPPTTDRRVVLLVGNYRNAGNRHAALVVHREILPRVVERVPDAVFRFIGRGLPEEIRHPNAEMAGFVDDLLEEYRRATVVIAPIEIGGGVKIKVVEGLASGSRVIATPKAMEGIDTSGMINVTVVPLTGFADAIVQALQAGPQKTPRNWDRVAARFGARTQLQDLIQRVDIALGNGAPR